MYTVTHTAQADIFGAAPDHQTLIIYATVISATDFVIVNQTPKEVESIRKI